MKKIAIIGSGSWGVALAIHLSNLGNKIKIWSFSEEEANLINKERVCKFLPGVRIPENIECTLKYEEAIKDSEVILHVTPSKFTRNIVREYKKYVTTQPIIICSKGLEKESLSTLDKVVSDEIPNVEIGILSGPSHAEEVSIGLPTVLVIASKSEKLLTEMQNLFMSENMRIYTSTDVVGVEAGGALKNILAFCAGIVTERVDLGDNTFAALLTRGLKEIASLGIAMGGEKQTFYGLSGLGDLLVTCLSEHSRNRKAGRLIGSGKTLEETRQEVGMTIESIDNIDVAYEMSKKYNVSMPILDATYNVIYNGLKIDEAVKLLMTREKKSENE